MIDIKLLSSPFCRGKSSLPFLPASGSSETTSYKIPLVLWMRRNADHYGLNGGHCAILYLLNVPRDRIKFTSFVLFTHNIISLTDERMIVFIRVTYEQRGCVERYMSRHSNYAVFNLTNSDIYKCLKEWCYFVCVWHTLEGLSWCFWGDLFRTLTELSSKLTIISQVLDSGDEYFLVWNW